jgi:hypothetical protein
LKVFIATLCTRGLSLTLRDMPLQMRASGESN